MLTVQNFPGWLYPPTPDVRRYLTVSLRNLNLATKETGIDFHVLNAMLTNFNRYTQLVN